MKIFSWMESNIFLANQIAEFLKQIYIKIDEVNQLDILYIDRDSGKVNRGLNNFGEVGS